VPSSNNFLVIAKKLRDKYKFIPDCVSLFNFLLIWILSGASLAPITSLCIRRVVVIDCRRLQGANLECPLLASGPYTIS
jgi:hypothetical protein